MLLHSFFIILDDYVVHINSQCVKMTEDNLKLKKKNIGGKLSGFHSPETYSLEHYYSPLPYLLFFSIFAPSQSKF